MITHICEHCRRATPDLTHNRAVDEYWCDGCFDEQTDEARLRKVSTEPQP